MSGVPSVDDPLTRSLSEVAPGRMNVMRGLLIIAGLLMTVGEITIHAGAPFVGLLIQAVTVLLLASARWQFSQTEPPPAAFTHACAVLALIPIMRLLSVTVAIEDMSAVAWMMLIGTPLLVVLLRLTGEQPHLRRMLRTPDGVGPQLVIALSGIPLGIVAWLLVDPEPLRDGSVFTNPVVAFPVITIFSGLVLELLFRGVLIDGLARFFGPWNAIYASSVLFGAFSIDAGGLWFGVLALYVGLMFGALVRRTGSLVGVSIANGLMTTGLLVVWPQVWG